ncbi:MAG: SDR family NAD(P)-dependent oxidoreductase, partial [Caldilinea sp.]
MQLVQTLADPAAAIASLPPRLWVVTQGAEQLSPTDAVAISQSSLWGLGRVVALEHGELWGGLIDVDPMLDPSAQAQALITEVLQPETTCEEQIAYRQGRRYVARLSAARPTLTTQTPLIRPDGAYLITGGLGSLGLQTAQWLVEQGARQLVLTGRRGVQTPQQQALLDELQRQGADIQLVQLDVSDEHAMRQLFQSLATATLPLRGIIHAAGVAGVQPIRALQWDEWMAVLRPKVIGGWLLHQLSASFALDFFLAYSSGAGIWGGKQQGHYAAANHFLDGLMAYRRRQGLPGLSIAWGPWAGPQGLPSMASTEGQAMLLSMGVRSFTPEQALAIQAYLLRTDAVQVTAADIDWPRLNALYKLTKPRRFLAKLAGEPPVVKPTIGETTDVTGVLQTLQAFAPSQWLAQIRDYVQQTVARVLGMTNLPDRVTGFTDLGMDSLMALALRRQLEQELQQPLPTTVAFEYPTVEKLAAYLLPQIQQRLGTPRLALAADEQTSRQAPAEIPSASADTAATQPIALISMACRFPGADTPEAFWELLRQGRDRVQEIPPLRWNVQEFYAPQRATPGKMYTRSAALLDKVDGFDPLFFGIAPREAVGMDPLHRLLLEVSWEALERAGLAQKQLVDSQTGVFVGIGESEYG